MNRRDAEAQRFSYVNSPRLRASAVKSTQTKVHVETIGKGQNLVLLHGWGLHSGVWDGVRGDLAARFRLHLVDLPGYGKSPALKSCTLPDIACAVASVTPEKVFVCGWSAGAQVALRWALDYPRQVKRLVLVSATPRFVSGSGWPCGIEPDALREFGAHLERDLQATLKRFVSLQTYGGENSRRQCAWLCQRLFAGADPALLQRGLQMLLDCDLRQEICKVEQPALLLHGSEDRLVPIAAAHNLMRLLSRPRLGVFEGCAHVPFLAQSAKFVKLVSEFLNE